jgi:hypothetical protein
MSRVLATAALMCVAAGGSYDFHPTAYAAPQAPVVNAKVDRLPAPQSIARQVQAIADRGAAGWVGYRVPMTRPANPSVRIGDTCCGRCRLEPPTDLVVLARVEAGRLVELRPVTVDCDIDAGGMPLAWFESVNPDDSIRWLESLAANASGRSATRLADAALVAMALHAAPAAAPALVRFAREGGSTHLRGQALVWLARRAAAQALPAITAAIDQDPETEVKRRAVSALFQMPRDEGIPRLIELARTHRNIEVQRQAFLYLGQSNDPRALAFFSDILLK